jgi:hypothetical protein
MKNNPTNETKTKGNANSSSDKPDDTLSKNVRQGDISSGGFSEQGWRISEQNRAQKAGEYFACGKKLYAENRKGKARKKFKDSIKSEIGYFNKVVNFLFEDDQERQKIKTDFLAILLEKVKYFHKKNNFILAAEFFVRYVDYAPGCEQKIRQSLNKKSRDRMNGQMQENHEIFLYIQDAKVWKVKYFLPEKARGYQCIYQKWLLLSMAFKHEGFYRALIREERLKRFVSNGQSSTKVVFANPDYLEFENLSPIENTAKLGFKMPILSGFFGVKSGADVDKNSQNYCFAEIDVEKLLKTRGSAICEIYIKNVALALSQYQKDNSSVVLGASLLLKGRLNVSVLRWLRGGASPLQPSPVENVEVLYAMPILSKTNSVDEYIFTLKKGTDYRLAKNNKNLVSDAAKKLYKHWNTIRAITVIDDLLELSVKKGSNYDDFISKFWNLFSEITDKKTDIAYLSPKNGSLKQIVTQSVEVYMKDLEKKISAHLEGDLSVALGGASTQQADNAVIDKIKKLKGMTNEEYTAEKQKPCWQAKKNKKANKGKFVGKELNLEDKSKELLRLAGEIKNQKNKKKVSSALRRYLYFSEKLFDKLANNISNEVRLFKKCKAMTKDGFVDNVMKRCQSIAENTNKENKKTYLGLNMIIYDAVQSKNYSDRGEKIISIQALNKKELASKNNRFALYESMTVMEVNRKKGDSYEVLSRIPPFHRTNIGLDTRDSIVNKKQRKKAKEDDNGISRDYLTYIFMQVFNVYFFSKNTAKNIKIYSELFFDALTENGVWDETCKKTLLKLVQRFKISMQDVDTLFKNNANHHLFARAEVPKKTGRPGIYFCSDDENNIISLVVLYIANNQPVMVTKRITDNKKLCQKIKVFPKATEKNQPLNLSRELIKDIAEICGVDFSNDIYSSYDLEAIYQKAVGCSLECFAKKEDFFNIKGFFLELYTQQDAKYGDYENNLHGIFECLEKKLEQTTCPNRSKEIVVDKDASQDFQYRLAKKLLSAPVFESLSLSDIYRLANCRTDLKEVVIISSDDSDYRKIKELHEFVRSEDVDRKGLFILLFSLNKNDMVKYIYVIQADQIFVAHESLDGAQRPTHSELAQGLGVDAAGELIFHYSDGVWKLYEINNASGHYRPRADKTLNFAKAKIIPVLKSSNINCSNVRLINCLKPAMTQGSGFGLSYDYDHDVPIKPSLLVQNRLLDRAQSNRQSLCVDSDKRSQEQEVKNKTKPERNLLTNRQAPIKQVTASSSKDALFAAGKNSINPKIISLQSTNG